MSENADRAFKLFKEVEGVEQATGEWMQINQDVVDQFADHVVLNESEWAGYDLSDEIGMRFAGFEHAMSFGRVTCHASLGQDVFFVVQGC